MKDSLFRFYTLYRAYLGVLLIGLGVLWGVLDDFTFAWILILVGLIFIAAHFLIGPIRLVQVAVEKGDLNEAQQVLDSIKYPNLLIKQVRSMYFFMQSNIAMSNKDYTKAEANIKKTTELGMAMSEYDGMAILQHGMIAFQKGDTKTALTKLREALKSGIPDKEAKAGALLTLCSISMNRRDFKGAKMYYKQAKDLKPTTKEIVSQLKELESYISRIPG